jgi:hypothetical protein
LRAVDLEGLDVDVGCEEVGDEDVGGQEGDVVFPDEGPDDPVSALKKGAGGADGEGGDSTLKGWPEMLAQSSDRRGRAHH